MANTARLGHAEGRPLAGLLACTAFSPLALHHPAHVAHAAHAAAHADSGLFGWLSDDRLGHEDVLRDRGRVLQRRARCQRRENLALADHRRDMLAAVAGYPPRRP